MKTRCPACGATNSLDALIAHEGARAALKTAMEMSPLGGLLLQYLGMFRPEKNALSFERFDKLLTEVLDVIKTAQVDRNGRTWPAPLSYWQAALEQVLAARPRLTLPLKSHGYLYEIVAGMSNKAEAQTEKAQQNAARHQTDTDRRHQADRQEQREALSRAQQQELLQKARQAAGFGGKKSTTTETHHDC